MYDADEDPMRFTLGVNVQLMMISNMLMLTVMVMMLMVSLVETALHWMKVCWYQIVRKNVDMVHYGQYSLLHIWKNSALIRSALRPQVNNLIIGSIRSAADLHNTLSSLIRAGTRGHMHVT